MRIKLTNAQQYAIRFIYDQQYAPKEEPQDVLLSVVPSYAMPGATFEALMKRGLVIWPADRATGIFLRLSVEAFRIAADLPSSVYNTGMWMKRAKFAWFEVEDV